MKSILKAIGFALFTLGATLGLVLSILWVHDAVQAIHASEDCVHECEPVRGLALMTASGDFYCACEEFSDEKKESL